MLAEPLSRIELLQGTLDLIILQTLRWGPRHGYGLAQMIRAGSRDVLQVDTGSLVVRQMTAEERIKYAESPQAAAERQSRRARKRS